MHRLFLILKLSNGCLQIFVLSLECKVQGSTTGEKGKEKEKEKDKDFHTSYPHISMSTERKFFDQAKVRTYMRRTFFRFFLFFL